MKFRCPELKFVVGQCKSVQHFRTAFWLRPFSAGLLGRKVKVTWDGWFLHPFTKKPYLRPTGHDNVCSVSDTDLYLQLNWVKKLPQARWNILKRWIFMIWTIFGKTQWKNWWTVSAALKGQEQQLARDLMSSLWWTAWKKVTSEIIDNDMCVCCAIYPPASTAKGLLILIIICMLQLGHWTYPSPARVRNVLAQVLHETQRDVHGAAIAAPCISHVCSDKNMHKQRLSTHWKYYT